MQGVTVKPGAIGMPLILFSQSFNTSGDTSLQRAITRYRQSLQSVLQCAPVLVENPVACEPAGTVATGPDADTGKNIISITTSNNCTTEGSWTSPETLFAS